MGGCGGGGGAGGDMAALLMRGREVVNGDRTRVRDMQIRRHPGNKSQRVCVLQPNGQSTALADTQSNTVSLPISISHKHTHSHTQGQAVAVSCMLRLPLLLLYLCFHYRKCPSLATHRLSFLHSSSHNTITVTQQLTVFHWLFFGREGRRQVYSRGYRLRQHTST